MTAYHTEWMDRREKLTTIEGQKKQNDYLIDWLIAWFIDRRTVFVNY